MKNDNSYTEYIIYDVLGHINGISTKPMFSGTGIYLDGEIVAFVTGGELYFKNDSELKEKYLSLDCHPFVYTKKYKDKEIELCYISATEEMIEDREIMSERIYESYEINNKN